MVGSFFEAPAPSTLSISFWSTCPMPLASLLRNSSESSVCPLVVYFLVMFIWHHCIFVFVISKACHCHGALTLCHILTWLFWGAHTIPLYDRPILRVWSQRVVCSRWRKEAALTDVRSLTSVAEQIRWDFRGHLLKDLCSCLLVCWVPLVTRVWEDIGPVNLKLFSLLGPQLPGLLQISTSCFVRPPSMLSAGGSTAATASFWSRERACRGKENPVFKSYQYFISHRV